MSLKAFFGPPILQPVAGGMHVGATVIPAARGKLWMLRRAEGIFGGPDEAWYFPTDYLLYAEPLEHCVRRLVREQAGLRVKAYAAVEAWSSLPGPDTDWHLGFVFVAEVAGQARRGPGVSEVRSFELAELPEKKLAWWTRRRLRRIFESALVRRLNIV